METGELMEIYNEQMQRIEKPDMALGWLEEAVRIVHHAAIEGIEEKWHYEVAAEYANGGKDVRRVVDVPGVQAKATWEEKIPILIYHPFTQEELAQQEEEKNRPTIQQRMDRMEEAVQALSGRFEEMIKLIAAQWTQKGA